MNGKWSMPSAITEQRADRPLLFTDKGFTVCAYNRTTSKVDNFLQNEAKGACELALARRYQHPL